MFALSPAFGDEIAWRLGRSVDLTPTRYDGHLYGEIGDLGVPMWGHGHAAASYTLTVRDAP